VLSQDKSGWSRKQRSITAVSLLVVLILFTGFEVSQLSLLQGVHAQPSSTAAAIAPSEAWGPFATNGTQQSVGDIQVNINESGIAVRVEIPRDFLQGVLQAGQENITSFIQTDIRNDYYYYNVMDESTHWTYAWKGVQSDGPCFKPNSPNHDPNAPWCVEIWNYMNGSFLNFTAPKFVRFHDLNAPAIAGLYNFTLFVANHVNNLGYPDFVNAWNTTLVVPVSMINEPSRINGSICDDDDPSNLCPTIFAKGVVYATNLNSSQVSRAYVNQTTGTFSIIGLAPGNYDVRASAGIYNGIAYSLSGPVYVWGLGYNQTVTLAPIHLKRASQICGVIEYHNYTDPANPTIRSVTGHPYLRKIGINLLNYTVEATDSRGNVYRDINVSSDQTQDNFRIIVGQGVKYVGLNATGPGLNPYGTEFAGLPPKGTLTVRVWITGYVQETIETVTLSQPLVGDVCREPDPSPIVVETGGIISGTIEFWNLVTQETPHQAELSLRLGNATDSLFGGNIVVQANDKSTGALRAVEVINGTYANGKTIYANSSSVRFYLFGFSEYYNRTWAGRWNEKDCGLPAADPVQDCLMPSYPLVTYTISVFIRGYKQAKSVEVGLPNGANETVTVKMIRGGAIETQVFSYINRFGTCYPQAEQSWRFLNLSIPTRARVYFHDSRGHTAGYVELLMRNGTSGVKTQSLRVVFAGQNIPIRNIYWPSYDPPMLPTYMDTDTYSINAYTLGYIQCEKVTAQIELARLSRAMVILLMGNEIGLTGPVFAQPDLFGKVTEHDHVLGETHLYGTLAGAVTFNTTAPLTTLILPLFGFGGIVLANGTLEGQGHFYYVQPDGTRQFDYGLDKGSYTIEIPEFGFNKHFMTMDPFAEMTFPDLAREADVFMDVVTMAAITQGVNGVVTGDTHQAVLVPLSWVRVLADSDSYQRSVVTLDGLYDGLGALFLPAGTYNLNYTVRYFKPEGPLPISVDWNGNYTGLVLVLCPLGGIGGICDPPPNHAPSSPSASWPFFFTLVGCLNARVRSCSSSLRAKEIPDGE
jgi:hypothetical protein